MPPPFPGYSIEMKSESLARHEFASVSLSVQRLLKDPLSDAETVLKRH